MGNEIGRDIRKLAKDNLNFRSELEKLEQDHSAWASNREERDLEKITKCLKRLEADVSVMASDCSSQVSRHDGNALGQDLHHAYVHINSLFEDVKKARTDLERAYIQPEEIGQIEIDWERLKKTVAQIAEHLES
ncbi:MAG: hypothetical protein WAL98_15725 [Desulfatiglandaceae bacterium]|jgi:uncharacterized protein YoxC